MGIREKGKGQIACLLCPLAFRVSAFFHGYSLLFNNFVKLRLQTAGECEREHIMLSLWTKE